MALVKYGGVIGVRPGGGIHSICWVFLRILGIAEGHRGQVTNNREELTGRHDRLKNYPTAAYSPVVVAGANRQPP